MLETNHTIQSLFDPPLRLPDGQGRIWAIPAPTVERGKNMAVIFAAVNAQNQAGGPCPACGKVRTEDLDEKTAARMEALQDLEFEEVILGSKIYQEMMAADLSGSEIYWIAMYTMWHFVLGAETAKELAAAYTEARNGEVPDLGPKADTPAP